MLESTLKWIILMMVLLIPAILLLHLWAHRVRIQQQTRWELELRRNFLRSPEKRGTRRVPTEVSKTLDRVVKAVERAAKTGKSVARVRMKKNFELQAVASDVIALKTAETTLYKSFGQVRIKNIKKTRQGYEIRFRGT